MEEETLDEQFRKAQNLTKQAFAEQDLLEKKIISAYMSMLGKRAGEVNKAKGSEYFAAMGRKGKGVKKPRKPKA
jgi:hypothetical protein